MHSKDIDYVEKLAQWAESVGIHLDRDPNQD